MPSCAGLTRSRPNACISSPATMTPGAAMCSTTTAARPSRLLARVMADAGRTYFAHGEFGPFIVSRPDRYLRGGDHTSFNKEGFTAVRITEWREDYNHQHQDVRIENGIQFGDLLQFV